MGILQPQQQNITAPAAYTEYSVKLPARANQPTFSLRVSDTIFWYTAPSGSVSPGNSSNLPAVYGTIPAGQTRTFNNGVGACTIYFQVASTNPGQVLEVDYNGDN